MSREEALRLYTLGSSWFSTEEGKKGALAPGQLADLAVLTHDYFSVPDEAIKGIESVLTIVDGKVVYATVEFQHLSPPPLPVSPDWSPVKHFGANRKAEVSPATAHMSAHRGCSHGANNAGVRGHRWVLGDGGLWGLGCDCFAF
jgi:hypothetical protein